MTDPWVDKPGFDIVSLLWDDKTTDSAAKVYNADLMDAFHEKLKAATILKKVHLKLMREKSQALINCCRRVNELEEEKRFLVKKAELWEQYAIYDNDKEEEILVKDLITAYEKLEAIREFVLSRKYDIEMEIENFEMLKPVLSYFLEESEN